MVMLVAVQLSVLGLYLPPVFRTPAWDPPQMIISLAVHTAVCTSRGIRRVGHGGHRPTIRAGICIWRQCSNSRCYYIHPKRSFDRLVHTAV